MHALSNTCFILTVFYSYEMSTDGWSDRLKLKEMTDDASWYLIVRDDDGNRKALVQFKFDMDYSVDVLYWYAVSV